MLAGAERVATIMARLCGLAILASVFLIAVEVISRKIFHVSLLGVDEIGGYVLAISVSWGASLALIRRAHVRIDILHARLPARVQAMFDLLALVSMLLFAAFFGWYATGLFVNSWQTGSVSNSAMSIPRWIPHGLWVAGFWVLAGVALVLIVEQVRALRRGDLVRAHHVAGVRGALEEAEREMQDARERL
jgi:TRAP-type C4-dicarboxylate transport system permease small subunit